ncbi:receptor protein kinase-like protein ZAR1 [Oryza glaberrima]|uniref:receptor protein kinase-like protein ZAR1 n=1 Tax=Oryza glaberrima TaxID=4538 RepID=UPI00224BE8E7|nr:receptor protein kinase-like protein ZAR1 [Oryza glaberrima]
MTTLPTAILLLLLLLALPPPSAVVALTADGLALLALKAAVTDDPLSVLSSWSESDPDPCRWPGVTCSNVTAAGGEPRRRVVGVALAGKNLSGYIPSELGSLLFLRRLNLHDNRLASGVPAALSNASSLHSLFLYGNRLTGALPAALCDIPRLQNLDVSRNALSGGLPGDLRNCRSLQRLILAGNSFSGEVPAGIWAEMASLQQLDISSNGFNGSIPADLGELPRLAGTLNLSHNRFSGVVPPELGRLPATVTLDLRFNNLSGAIPQTGSLASQGPTSFLNNPGLCGFPLQVPCRAVPPPTQSPPAPTTTTTTTTPSSASAAAAAASEHHQPIRTSLIALISIADAAGVALVGVILVYVYWKVKDRKKQGRSSTVAAGDENESRHGLCRCIWGHRGVDSDTDTDDSSASENGGGGGKYGEGELVAIDRGFRVELDELLRSSAYVLGKGGKGIVYKVVVGNGATPVAVRRLGGGGGGGERCKEFAAEARAVGRARHPNVVRLRAYYWSADEKLVVTDFVGNGNLAAAMRGRPGQTPLSWSTRLKIARGAARGLAYLHECSPRRFVHGEVKPSNILLDADFTPRVADFGLARLLAVAGCADDVVDAPPAAPSSGGLLGGAIPYAAKPASSVAADHRGGGYRAPEARAAGARPAQKWDVFSFGVVLMELLTGRGPGDHASPSTSASFSAPSSSSAATTDRSGSGEHGHGAGVGGAVVPEVVRWVRRGFEEEARPVAEMVDPALLRDAPPLPKKEVVAAFHLALACTELDADLRPRMKAVADTLDKIASS